MVGAQQVAGLLASRICHDLVSPVGAIANGTDLIREIGGGDIRDEVTMIGQSANRASSLLQFYRVAFGAASPDDASLSTTELHRHAEQMIGSDKIDLDWKNFDAAPLPRPQARLIYLILMCARAIMGMRGRIGLELHPNGASHVVLQPVETAAGTGGKPNSEFLALLENEPNLDQISPRSIEFALVHHAAASAGVNLRVDRQGETVTVTAN